MNKDYVEFKKERDLGAIITDTFKFIRLEWKNFFKSILSIAAIPIGIAGLSMVYYLNSLSSIVGDNYGDPTEMIGTFAAIFIAIIFYMVGYAFLNLSSLYYIKLYIENKGEVETSDVLIEAKNKFWSLLGYIFIMSLLMMVSIMLCFFPMFYVLVLLSIGLPMLVFQDKTAISVIPESIEFLKGYFWKSFIVIIVVGMLIGMLSGVFQIPAFIYQIIKMMTLVTSDDPQKMTLLFNDPIYLLLNLISLIGTFLLYSISLIANSFLYFSINESKNATGTFEKIENLGR